jgi:hypothetical protein
MVSTRKVIPKACDACRRRKVKCNGQQPCSGCMSATLTCAYDSPRKQGGNRGARATVLNELRGAQIQHAATASPASTSGESATVSPATPYQPETTFMQACIDTYVRRIQVVVPIMSLHGLETEVLLAKSSVASRQLVLAFCAYVANFGNALSETRMEQAPYFNGDMGRQSLHDALRVLDPTLVTKPIPHSMLISFFLYGAYTGLGDYQQGWFYLRQATTLFMMLQRHGVDWYDERAHSCMFWILLVSERYVFIFRTRAELTQKDPMQSEEAGRSHYKSQREARLSVSRKRPACSSSRLYSSHLTRYSSQCGTDPAEAAVRNGYLSSSGMSEPLCLLTLRSRARRSQTCVCRNSGYASSSGNCFHASGSYQPSRSTNA